MEIGSSSSGDTAACTDQPSTIARCHNTFAPECVYVLRSAAFIRSVNHAWAMIDDLLPHWSGCSGIGPWQYGEDGEVMVDGDWGVEARF